MSPEARTRDVTVGLALALGVAASTALLVRSGAPLTEEDGFYYLKIAQNLAAGRGSTFDGLHRTNGYQPLWLWVLLPIFRLRPSPEAGLRAAVLLQGALLAVSTALLYLLARARLAPPASALGALVWVALLYRAALSGVELALVGVLLAAVALLLVSRFARAEGEDGPSAAAYATLGILLALSVLARLDNLLLAALVCAYVTRRARTGPGRARRLALLWMPAMTAGAAYAALNAAWFGYPLPVSGLVKRLFSAELLQQDRVYQSAGWVAAKAVNILRPLRHVSRAPMTAVVLGGFLPCLLIFVRSIRPRGRPFAALDGGVLEPLRPLVAFAGLQPIAYGLVFHGHYSFAPWYFAAQPLLAALLAAALADALGRRMAAARGAPRRVPAAACAIGAALVALFVSRPVWTHARKEPLYIAALWARENLDRGARIGTWNAGTIGYLSERQVVNLDGVVNTIDFVRREQYDLCAYWKRTGITHLVDIFEAREGSTSMLGSALPVSRFYDGCAAQLEPIWTARVPGNPGWPKAFRIRIP